MFCEKCGAQNNDYDYVCAVCGAPLNNARMMQSAYAPTARTKKRVTDRAAKMFMLINAILSLVMVCMPFLPLYVEKSEKNGDSYGNIVRYYFEYETGTESRFFSMLLLAAMAVAIVGAIRAFMGARSAVVFTLSAAVYFICEFFGWTRVFLMNISDDFGDFYSSKNTVVPLFIVLVAAAVIVTSVIALIKSRENSGNNGEGRLNS